MISKFAIERFLSRELETFEWIKSLSRKELLSAIGELNPVPEFTGPHKPYNHQLAAFLLGVYMPRFLFLLDLGVGKTRVVLDLVSYLKRGGWNPRFLIVVPNVPNIENWVIEVETYAPTLECVALEGSSQEKATSLHRTGDIYLTTYPGLVALCASLEPRKKDPKKRHRVLDEEKIAVVASKMTGMVLDESTAVMNHNSTTYKVCKKIGSIVPFRYALTGTPFGRDPQALWSQFYFIDRGETLGPTLGVFREAFFNKKKNYWGGYEYKFKGKLPKSRSGFLRSRGRRGHWARKLHRMLCNKSIFYDESECVDLPPKSHQNRLIPRPKDTMVYYERIKERLVEAKGDFQIVRNSFHNMRQLASGFLGLKDDETGERAQIEFPENPKLDVLMELISEMPSDSKMVVFHEYVWTGNKICETLKAARIRYERLGSGQKDPRLALRRFRTNPAYRIFVVNNHSGAFGLNLQVANYGVFFETPTAPIIRKQCEKRIRRSGQKKRVFFIDLIMKDTKDEQIKEYLAEGEDLFRAIVAGNISPRKLAA